MNRSTIVLLACLPLAGNLAAVDKTKKGETVSSEDVTADSLLIQADGTFQTRDYKKALSQYQEVVEQARVEFNNPVEVEALAQVARMNLILGNKEEGRTVLAEAFERARESAPYGWSRYLGVKGRFEWQDDDLAAARRTFDEMYNYCTVNQLWGRAVDAAHMIAIVAETPEEQIEWGRKGIEAAEANEIDSWLGPLWNNLAGTYYDIKELDSALECYLKAREYHWRHSGEVAKLFADYHVGMTYRHLADFDQAAQWLRPVLAWGERLENHSVIGQACEDLGEVELAIGNRDSGMELLRKALSEYEKGGLDKSWPKIYNQLKARIKDLEG